jgi:hypothetical protein
MWQQYAYRMIQRRAADTDIKARIGNHTFRATGITAYLKNNGTIEHAQYLAAHESPRTTKLYDRRAEEISLDEGREDFDLSRSHPCQTAFAKRDYPTHGITIIETEAILDLLKRMARRLNENLYDRASKRAEG